MIAFLLLASVSLDCTATETVDCIEVNHLYDDQAKRIFTQVIFWDDGDVVAWRLVKSRHQLPQRDWRRGGYQATWLDGNRLRTVRAMFARETWTQYDRELVERARLPK